MPSNETNPVDPKETLCSRRIGAAITAITDPDRTQTGPTVHLDEEERDSIRQALRRSHHPLARFADGILDQWDQLDDDDRAAGLLLFTELIRTQGWERRLERGVER